MPLSLALILTVSVLDKLPFMENLGDISRAGFHLVGNLVIGYVTLEIMRRHARRQRLAQDMTLAARMVTDAESDPAAHAAPEAVAAH